MKNARSRTLSIVAGVAIVVSLAGFQQAPPSTADPVRADHPGDRYAMAGGCYAVRSLATGAWIGRTTDGFALSATGIDGAEPFHFQATDLGRYLLFDAQSDYLAASDGTIGQAKDTAMANPVVATADGLTIQNASAAATTLADGPAGAATGRGSSVVRATAPSELADFEIDQTGPDAFSIRLPSTGTYLAANGASLALAARPDAGFAFTLTSGCATFPEIEVNVDGAPFKGASSFAETKGFIDAHLHMMAFEFIGGRVRCGRPWHPYGVAYALVDCPDHQVADGRGAVLESVLDGETPGSTHPPDGWPSFNGWPKSSQLTQEQVYYKWLERAYRAGLRMFTNLLVDNHALCTVYPLKKNSCNEMDGVRLQMQDLRKLQDYIDAQNGGPGKGWFRIVADPFQARSVINDGKLAVVPGIEVSIPFNCGLKLDIPECTPSQIDQQLDEVYALGVRQMELGNKFDNALTGITGDGGTTGVVVNSGNKQETGRYWQMQTCPDPDVHGTDNTQLNLHDNAPAANDQTGRDSIFAGVLQVSGTTGVAPAYPPGPQCNVRGLSALGEYAIRGMIRRGMIFDPDHMSAIARHQALDILADAGYSGLISSHSWSDDTIYRRVWPLGGLVAPHAGSSQNMVNKWNQNRAWADPRFTFGFGWGSDMNGFSGQGGPRGANAPNPVTYPFTALGGAVVHQQVSGTHVYDFNTDGVAHYGMYADWVEDVRHLGGQQVVDDMAKASEAYLEMWERGVGVKPDACRSDVPDLTDADLNAALPAMTPELVLRTLGQPKLRDATSFSYCMTGGRTGKVVFTPAGVVDHVDIV